MKRLCFIYTIPNFYNALYKPVMSEAFDGREDVEVRFLMDNSILLDTLANGAEPTPAVERRLLRFAEDCAAVGADCIVVGCTAVNTATKKVAEMMEIPMFSVDEPMIRKVLADKKKRIAVLSHTPINAGTIRRRLLAEDPTVAVELFPVDGAGDAFAAGDYERYHALMKAGAEAIPEGFDAIVLGHISAEHVDFSEVRTPIYSTGSACVSAIEEALKNAGGKMK